MNFSTIKKLSVTSAVALALGFGSMHAHAQSVAVGTTFTTAAALAVTDVADMAFGTYAINVSGGDTLALTIVGATATGTAAATTCTGAVDPGSTCTEVTAPATTGGVNVDVPVNGTVVQISGSVTTDFADANLSLGTLTYTHGAVSGGALPTAFDGTTVTIAAAATPEFVGLGGTLSITGNPAAATTFNDAEVTFNVSY